MASATKVRSSERGYKAHMDVLRAFLVKALTELQRIRGVIAEHEQVFRMFTRPNYRTLAASLTATIERAAEALEQDNAVLSAAMGIARPVGERFAVTRIMLIRTLREFGSRVEHAGFSSAALAERAFTEDVITPFIQAVSNELPRLVEQDFLPASLLADFNAEAERRGLRA
jgi:hypothetical protein